MSRRAVVTGLGVIAPNGTGRAAWWDATCRGESGIRPITRFDAASFPVRLAGEIPDFTPERYLEQRQLVQTDRATQLGLAAAELAREDAGLATDGYGSDAAVLLATASGNNSFVERELQHLWAQGPIFVGAYTSVGTLPAASAGQLSIGFGTKGPAWTFTTDAAGGLDALAEAAREIKRGRRLVLAGGMEAPLTPFALMCQLRSGALSPEPDRQYAYRPFDVRATGYVPGEGGAVLVVEEAGEAEAREATIYGELAGAAATHDAYQPNRVEPSAEEYARAIRLALERAGVDPGDVDVIWADAFGTRQRDAAEVKALQLAFGDRLAQIPLTAPKTMTGRLYGASGVLDVAAALCALHTGWIPPTINVSRLAPDCQFDLVTGQARQASPRVAVVLARGLGGFNRALVLRRYGPDAA